MRFLSVGLRTTPSAHSDDEGRFSVLSGWSLGPLPASHHARRAKVVQGSLRVSAPGSLGPLPAKPATGRVASTPEGPMGVGLPRRVGRSIEFARLYGFLNQGWGFSRSPRTAIWGRAQRRYDRSGCQPV